MKHCFLCVICLACLLMLAGCAGQTEAEGTAAPQSQSAGTAETASAAVETAPAETGASAPVQEETPSEQEGTLLFSVSEITFSLVGESEKIYLGLIPEEEVTWETSDPDVAVLEDGILTAVGTGTAQVRAVYGASSVSATVNCLAETEEELYAMPYDVLHAPKRLPPAGTFENPEFFADAAIVGDSITYIMFQHEMENNMLGHPQFLARGGVSINSLMNHSTNILFRGAETYLEDAVEAVAKKKIFMMLGQNDLGFTTVEEALEHYDTLISHVREKNPDTVFYLQTCLPEWSDYTKPNDKNAKIDEFNEALKEFAAEKGHYLVDIAPYFEDHVNRMASVYSMDHSIHANKEGTAVWMQMLNFYSLYLLK